MSDAENRADEVRAQLIGTWAMKSCESYPPDNPYNRKPVYSATAVGFLIYTADGFMTSLVHDSHGNRVNCNSGNFSLDIARNGMVTVIHHVKASFPLNWVGTDQRRRPEVNGGELRIYTDSPIDIGDGELKMVDAIFKRAKDVYPKQDDWYQ